MAHGERASWLQKLWRKEYWGRLTGRERQERRRGERRIVKALQVGNDVDAEPITSRRGRSEETR